MASSNHFLGMKKKLKIIKASGSRESFKKQKLYQSMRRVGVAPGLAEDVLEQVTKKVRPEMATGKILEETRRCLLKEDPVLAARYNLKRALMLLGPTGFPFEKYVAAILREYGFTTRVGEQVSGFCVNHEIDVIAEKGEKHFMIECKYHNRRGRRSDTKVALYTFARFLDVKRAWQEREEREGRREKGPGPGALKGGSHLFHQAWLVTNTRCTSEAIRYAQCQGLKIVSWRYPKKGGLEDLIERKGLYPLTILPRLSREARERLARQAIMLAKDLEKYSSRDLARLTALKIQEVKKLQEEARRLCL